MVSPCRKPDGQYFRTQMDPFRVPGPKLLRDPPLHPPREPLKSLQESLPDPPGPSFWKTVKENHCKKWQVSLADPETVSFKTPEECFETISRTLPSTLGQGRSRKALSRKTFGWFLPDSISRKTNHVRGRSSSLQSMQHAKRGFSPF